MIHAVRAPALHVVLGEMRAMKHRLTEPDALVLGQAVAEKFCRRNPWAAGYREELIQVSQTTAVMSRRGYDPDFHGRVPEAFYLYAACTRQVQRELSSLRFRMGGCKHRPDLSMGETDLARSHSNEQVSRAPHGMDAMRRVVMRQALGKIVVIAARRGLTVDQLIDGAPRGLKGKALRAFKKRVLQTRREIERYRATLAA